MSGTATITTGDVSAILQAITPGSTDISTAKDLLNQIGNNRQLALSDASGALFAAQNGQIDFLRTYKRGNELYKAQTELLSTQMPERLQSDVNTSRRQFEIDEYYYNYKLNILYMMQVLYIAILLCIIPIACMSWGFISIIGVVITVLIIAVVAAVLIGKQVWYNKKWRDNMFWNKRYFNYVPVSETETTTTTSTTTCSA